MIDLHLTKLRLPDSTEMRSALRRAAEAAKNEIEFKPCQNVVDFRLPFKKHKRHETGNLRLLCFLCVALVVIFDGALLHATGEPLVSVQRSLSVAP